VVGKKTGTRKKNRKLEKLITVADLLRKQIAKEGGFRIENEGEHPGDG